MDAVYNKSILLVILKEGTYMTLTKAGTEHFDIVKNIVRTTIESIYPNYYPSGAVDFFLQHHSDNNIKEAIKRNSVFLLDENKIFVGTGSIYGNEINRLFVLPQYQRKGYGTIIMDELEKKIFEKYSEAILDASFPAYDMYINRGYLPVKYHKIETENGHFLCYHVMKKSNFSNDFRHTLTDMTINM